MQHKQRLFGKLAAIGVLLLFTIPTNAQTTTTHINHTKKLLDATTAFIQQVQAVCKTDECSALVTQANQILNDAQTKIKNHQMDADSRKQFHTDLQNVLMKLREALVNAASATTPTVLLHPSGGAHLVLTQAGDPYQCELCDKVFAQTSAICALYTVASPLAAAACEAVVLYKYDQCIQQYCGNPQTECETDPLICEE